MNVVDQLRRTAADEDGTDQIGYDTPRSGVATPQPDLHDRRLPGIMTYFGQVRLDSSCPQKFPSHASGEGERNNTLSCTSDRTTILPRGGAGAAVSESTTRAPADATAPKAVVNNRQAIQAERTLMEDVEVSRQGAARKVAGSRRISPSPGRPALPRRSVTDFVRLSSRRVSSPAPALISSVTAFTASSTASSRDPAPNPAVSPMSSKPNSPEPVIAKTDVAAKAPQSWFSFDTLKKLTGTMYKSGTSTPTRTLSTAQPSRSGEGNGVARRSHESVAPSRSQTPRPLEGAEVPMTKGKLTVKIVEARGLRRCKAPYVVVVFQRNELISHGPYLPDEEGPKETTLGMPGMGGIPIQRQGSDSGRPGISIPMRSRQSSNTSVHEHDAFKNRSARTSFTTNPKWDAEAVFDVVNSDMLVDISVYDRGNQGEIFLGHVDLQATKDGDSPVTGWFTLIGRADTVAEEAPTGDVFVEASFQSADKKHFGPEDFVIIRLIGRGTFGQVYQVRKTDTGRIYAMKVLSKKVIVQKKEVAHTVGERNILVRTATSDSPFIVGLKYSFQTPSDLYLVTDFLSGGELFWHLQKEGRFDEKRAKFYIAELILAIQHLHDNDIVYRDLKPENILLDANGHIALCDFGLSKANLNKNDTTNTFCGTTEYLAPEVLLDEAGYTKMVDFWSLGVLVFEMCCGWSPFYAEDIQQMYKNIAFGKVRFPRETLSQEGRNFVKGLLNRNPKHRLGATDDAEELKRHPFFADVDWDLLSKKLISPPFKPNLSSETDVSYFDPEFTNALDHNGSLNERAAMLAKGIATSTPLSPSVQANFQGFTFVGESALDDHMAGRAGSDEEMNDAHHSHDEEWDSLDDIDLRRGNRMSGVVRTAPHDEVFGGPHFDD